LWMLSAISYSSQKKSKRLQGTASALLSGT
jgi:hypothetical protein